MINFGIEYELEKTCESYCPSRGWRAEHDGTLRDGGVEFVFRDKATLADSKERIVQLLANIGNNFTVSHRCSTHIHADTQRLNGYARVSFLLGLIIHDNFFFQYGNGRDKNNFCTPVLYNPSALSAINRTVRTRNYNSNGQRLSTLPASRSIRTIADYDMKYMSVNTMPVQDWGSIELRHFAPLTDINDVNAVLDKIAELYKHASQVGNVGKNDAASVWTDYDPALKDEIEWVQNIYNIHKSMTG